MYTAHRRPQVYTKTGDGGSSQLFTGERRSKSDPVFEALGSTDELNGHLGVAREHAANDGLTALDGQLQEIMSRLVSTCSATLPILPTLPTPRRHMPTTHRPPRPTTHQSHP